MLLPTPHPRSCMLIASSNVDLSRVTCWQVLGKVGEGGGTSALRNVRCRQSQSRHSLLASPGGGLAFKYEKLAAHSFERMVSHTAVSTFHPSPSSHHNRCLVKVYESCGLLCLKVTTYVEACCDRGSILIAIRSTKFYPKCVTGTDRAPQLGNCPVCHYDIKVRLIAEMLLIFYTLSMPYSEIYLP